MADTHVPLLLRWLMWTAVSARTRIKGGGIGRITTIAWLVLYAILGCLGIPALVIAVIAGRLPWRMGRMTRQIVRVGLACLRVHDRP